MENGNGMKAPTTTLEYNKLQTSSLGSC